MEKHKLIKNRFCLHIFVVSLALMSFALQPSVFSETEYVKPAKHVLTLQSKETFEVRNGRIIFREHCAPCHGLNGNGKGRYFASGLEPKPRDFTDPKFMKQVKDEYLAEVIKKGTAVFGKSPFCPPWGNTLKEDEKIQNIIAFLRTLCK